MEQETEIKISNSEEENSESTSLVLNPNEEESDILFNITGESTQTSLKNFIVKALPLSIKNVVESFNHVIQTKLLANTGSSNLAASGIVFTAAPMLVYPIIGLVSQTPIFVSQEFGYIKSIISNQNSEDINLNIEQQKVEALTNIKRYMQYTWLSGTIMCIPAMTILGNMHNIIKPFIHDAAVRQSVSEYFLPNIFSIPIDIFNITNYAFLSAIDKEKYAVPLSIIRLASDIGLSAWLIPSFGIKGAGYISLAASAISALSFITVAYSDKEIRKFQLFTFKRNELGLRDILTYLKDKMLFQGLPISIYTFSIFGSSFISSILTGKIGIKSLNVYHSVSQIINPLYAISRGFSEAGNRYVAQALGVPNFKLLKRYGKFAIVAAPGIVLGGATLLAIPAPAIANIFLGEKNIDIDASYIRLTFVLLALAKMLNLLEDAAGFMLAGMQDTFLTASINILATFAIILPLEAVSSYVLEWDIYGILSSLCIGYSVSSFVLSRQFLQKSNQAIAKNSFDPKKETSNVVMSQFIKSAFICNTSKTTKENNILINNEDLDTSSTYQHS